jgi:CBS domain-containing protein
MTRLDQLTVADVMTIDPVVVAVEATLETAEELLESYRISGLPVVDATGRLVGVISQSDLLAPSGRVGALVRGRASGLRVGELMSSPVVTVPISASVVEAARLMRDERIHRVVAVDETERPIGVVAASDYVKLVADLGALDGASSGRGRS